MVEAKAEWPNKSLGKEVGMAETLKSSELNESSQLAPETRLLQHDCCAVGCVCSWRIAAIFEAIKDNQATRRHVHMLALV